MILHCDIEEAIRFLVSAGFPDHDNEMPTPDYNYHPIGTIWNFSTTDYDGSRIRAEYHWPTRTLTIY